MNRNSKLLRAIVDRATYFRLPVCQRRQIVFACRVRSSRAAVLPVCHSACVNLASLFFARQASADRKVSGEMEQSKFKDHLIVPDILEEAPQEICDVKFSASVHAMLGNELRPEDVKEPPSVKWPAEKGAFYTLVIADLDTQNPEKNEGEVQWQQYVVMNIPENNISRGKVLSEYIGAGPLPGTGLHRYAVVVYKQKGQLQPKEPFYSKADGDRKFSLSEFEKKYSLGKPIAANFYQAKYDEAVKELYLENEEMKDKQENQAKVPGLPSV
ncbi:hypothetical protein RvY_15986 [Ramazzottius varieornatus]|uniref:Phosphatidylethanolamine-binding protein n=1 Tax=Ramazzottius varieornatus TaxID=947166 RepID=A0A1D1W3J2_RAMVA|nr:hypothetical protein RvY_15986 [Ramazzottius varieornatus]